MGTNNLDSDGFFFFIQKHFDLPDLFALGKTSVIVFKLFDPDGIVNSGSLGGFFVHSDTRQLRIGISAPR